MPGARRRRLGREAAAAAPHAHARGRRARATATAAAAKPGPLSDPVGDPRLARLCSRDAHPRLLRDRRHRCRCTSSGLARHCNWSPSRHAQRVKKRPRRRRTVAPLGIRPRHAIGSKVNGGRFTWPKFDQKKKKKNPPARAVCGLARRGRGPRRPGSGGRGGAPVRYPRPRPLPAHPRAPGLRRLLAGRRPPAGPRRPQRASQS
jgi:hypothetical protein